MEGRITLDGFTRFFVALIAISLFLIAACMTVPIASQYLQMGKKSEPQIIRVQLEQQGVYDIRARVGGDLRLDNKGSGFSKSPFYVSVER
jgi:starvation-inducible outer membrane lipoprotein